MLRSMGEPKMTSLHKTTVSLFRIALMISVLITCDSVSLFVIMIDLICLDDENDKLELLNSTMGIGN